MNLIKLEILGIEFESDFEFTDHGYVDSITKFLRKKCKEAEEKNFPYSLYRGSLGIHFGCKKKSEIVYYY